MNNHGKLVLIKILHTVIWLFFNVVIFYFLYAVIVNHITIWMWLSIGFIFLEVLVLTAFKTICPITLMARKYSDSQRDNFDIYLPNWLARHNKLIYTIIVAIGVCVLIYRLVTNE